MKKTAIFLVVFIFISLSAFAKINIRLDSPYFDNSTTTNVANFIGKKPLILVFFYPDCTPCDKEAKTINKICEEYDGKINIIGISLSRDRYDIEDFMEDYHPRYSIWRIHSKSDLRYVGGILATPTVVFIDIKGRILTRFIGERKKSEFEKVIEQLLKEE